MENKPNESEVKIETAELKLIEPKQTSEPIVISQKGKNTRNIPAVLFIVHFY